MSSLSSEKLKKLIEINCRINAKFSDTDALPVLILKSVMQIVDCESSSLIFVKKEDGSLRFVKGIGGDGSEIAEDELPVDARKIADSVVKSGKTLVFNESRGDKIPYSGKNGPLQKNSPAKTVLAVPVNVQGRCRVVLLLVNKKNSAYFERCDIELLQIFAVQTGITLLNSEKFRILEENYTVLQEKTDAGKNFHLFIAESPVMKDLLHIADGISNADTPVLITGEYGTGKRMLAEQIHLRSSRKNMPFISVNCAVLDEQMLEKIFFAGNNSVSQKFSEAACGTIFLDEVGRIPYMVQRELLRILQNKNGTGENEKLSVRIIASSSDDLERNVEEGLFDGELYYRLSVMPLHVPPLRNRRDDIIPLANLFLREFMEETKKKFEGFSPEAEDILLENFWHGNVRELKNTVERACIAGMMPFITAENVFFAGNDDERSEIPCSLAESVASETANEIADDRTLKNALTKFKTAYLKKILSETSWNQTEAGKILGIQRTYVCRLMNELNIRK